MGYSLLQLSDLESIRECARRYCQGVDRLDPTLMKSAYWPEANDNHGSYNGPAWPFVDHCMISHQRWRSTSHCIMNHTVSLAEDGAHASGEIYNVTYLFHKDDSKLDTWHGRYLDRYQKREDEWRIIDRVCLHEGTHTQSIESMQIDTAAFHQGDGDRGINLNT